MSSFIYHLRVGEVERFTGCGFPLIAVMRIKYVCKACINTLSPELNPMCYLLSLLAHDFLHVSRIRVKSLTLRLLMSYIYVYIYGALTLDVSRSHTTTQHNPPGARIFVCCECRVLSGRGLCDRADHSSRGVLPTVVRRCV
jgi:hypothetical protein